MDIQCTRKRIDNKKKKLLIKERTTYMNYKNENESKIYWKFTKEDGDKKLSNIMFKNK